MKKKAGKQNFKEEQQPRFGEISSSSPPGPPSLASGISPLSFLLLEIEEISTAFCWLADCQQFSKEIASPYPLANSADCSGGKAAGERLFLIHALPFSSQFLLRVQKLFSGGGGGGCMSPRIQAMPPGPRGGSHVPLPIAKCPYGESG